ncbi:hypothetical protein [Thalassomonas actiniarum]|uniref:Uncharacterized protein n=1 Tax=Thalassomonas actiniarum TaxID=485447 RepID=A0AAF0C3A0_9GAMM|nr:hypothetical protein [Thalassomonas actiniarum]WDD98469.1 hypothetical protein SG35_024965 [Thalassomonas actiniarum]
MTEPKLSRWQLLRDIGIFQVKLALDAIRDLLLSPVSIVSAVIDLIKGHQYPHSYFYKVMRLGRKTDHWLNLFGAAELENKPVKEELSKDAEVCSLNNTPEPGRNLDDLFCQVEALLKEQHDRGGLTATAKASIDRCLDKIITKSESKPSVTDD